MCNRDLWDSNIEYAHNIPGFANLVHYTVWPRSGHERSILAEAAICELSLFGNMSYDEPVDHALSIDAQHFGNIGWGNLCVAILSEGTFSSLQGLRIHRW